MDAACPLLLQAEAARTRGSKRRKVTSLDSAKAQSGRAGVTFSHLFQPFSPAFPARPWRRARGAAAASSRRRPAKGNWQINGSDVLAEVGSCCRRHRMQRAGLHASLKYGAVKQQQATHGGQHQSHPGKQDRNKTARVVCNPHAAHLVVCCVTRCRTLAVNLTLITTRHLEKTCGKGGQRVRGTSGLCCAAAAVHAAPTTTSLVRALTSRHAKIKKHCNKKHDRSLICAVWDHLVRFYGPFKRSPAHLLEASRRSIRGAQRATSRRNTPG